MTKYQLRFMEGYHQETLYKAMSHAFKYHRYTQEEISAYNQVNLIELCIFISERSLIYKADRLCLAKFPHVIVYAEGFYDTKSCIYYTAIDGLRKFYGFDFPQACYIIQRYFESEAILYIGTYAKARYTKAYNSCLSVDFNLNYLLKDNMLDRGGNNSLKMVFAILHNRMGIDRDVIKMFISSKKLIVNQRFDLCFLEHESDVIIASINKLHNYEHMAIEVLSVKRNTTFTWNNDNCQYCHSVYVFEDVYQLMSYLTLINKGLVPSLEKNSIMLSLNGTSFSALRSYLYTHKDVKKVYACLSNTELSIDTLKDIPFDKDKIINMQTHLKDYTKVHGLVETWNDMLKSHNRNSKE